MPRLGRVHGDDDGPGGHAGQAAAQQRSSRVMSRETLFFALRVRENFFFALVWEEGRSEDLVAGEVGCEGGDVPGVGQEGAAPQGAEAVGVEDVGQARELALENEELSETVQIG